MLPNHGAPEVIATGGYRAALLVATADYIRYLQTADLAVPLTMAQVMAPHLATLRYFAPYEAVHAQNLQRVQEMRRG